MPKINISEFFVEGSNPQKSHVLIHIAEPNTPEEEKRGYFFALAEINNNNPNQITNFQNIIDEIESKYYEEDEDELDIENLFEKIISQINKKGGEVLSDSDSEINCLVSIIRNNKIIIAYHGYPNALLFFKKNEKTENLKIIDSPAISSTQLFCSVIEGNINDEDTIFFYTPKVKENLDIEKIKNILIEKNINDVSNFSQKSLELVKNEYSYGGIFIKKTKSEEKKLEYTENTTKISSNDSIQELNDTEKNTEEILTPKLFSGLHSKFKNIKKKRKNKKEQDIKTTKHGIIETNIRQKKDNKDEQGFLVKFGKIIIIILKYILNFIKDLFFKIKDLILSLLLFLTNKHGKRTIILDKYQTKIKEKKQKVNNFGILPKIFFISILILIILFTANVFYLKIKEKKEAEEAQHNNLITMIEDKIDDAKAKLLYGEESKAFELLKKASEISNSLNIEDNEERIAEKKSITEKIDGILMQLRKITIIKPNLISEITNNSSESITTDGFFFIDENKIIAFGENDNNLYIINPITKNIEIKNHDIYNNFRSAKIDTSNNLVYFLYDKNKILEYSIKNNSFSNKEISYPNENIDIRDFELYNNRIYTFDKNNQQIYKHSKTQTGFDKGVEWIIEKKSDLTEVDHISIDSSIFLLGKEQEIYKFNKGKEIKFEITGIDPIIEKAEKIWTEYESDYIYILDSKNNRVIILDKEGHFISQYLAQNWNEPEDMFIDEKNNIIYILDDNKIYNFIITK